MVLAAEGHAVVTAADGATGIASYHETQPDVGLEGKRVHAPRAPWERVEIRVEVCEGRSCEARRCELNCVVLRRTRFLPRGDNPWTP